MRFFTSVFLQKSSLNSSENKDLERLQFYYKIFQDIVFFLSLCAGAVFAYSHFALAQNAHIVT
jgi:hypothetical protein